MSEFSLELSQKDASFWDNSNENSPKTYSLFLFLHENISYAWILIRWVPQCILWTNNNIRIFSFLLSGAMRSAILSDKLKVLWQTYIEQTVETQFDQGSTVWYSANTLYRYYQVWQMGSP